MTEPPRFEVVYHKDTCLFDFVNNLAEWHFACNRHYNRIWLSETGELAPAECAALKSFTCVAKHFPYGDSWVGTPFVRYAGDPSLWARVEEIVGREAGRNLWDALRAMESRFDLVWQKDLPRLEALRSRLRTRLSEHRCAKAMDALEAYLGSPFPNVTINLLLSRGRGSASGGANEGPGHITLAALETADLGRAVEIAFHEVMHLMEAERFVPLYDAMSRRHRLREYIAARSMGGKMTGAPTGL